MTNSQKTFTLPADNIYLTDIEIKAHKMRAEAFATLFTSLFGAVKKTVTGAINFVSNKLERSRVQNELYAMDDRTLEDIGLTRGDIEDVMNGNRHRTQLTPVAANIEFWKQPVDAATAPAAKDETRIAA